MLVILIIKNDTNSLVWSAYFVPGIILRSLPYLTHLVFVINPVFYTGELRHKEVEQPFQGHTAS